VDKNEQFSGLDVGCLSFTLKKAGNAASGTRVSRTATRTPHLSGMTRDHFIFQSEFPIFLVLTNGTVYSSEWQKNPILG
jgi:hypothetical protein